MFNSKKHIKALSLIVLVFISLGVVGVIYTKEKGDVLKGVANLHLKYRFQVVNEGPLNLSFLSVRLALLKDWDPVQKVSELKMYTPPNRTTTDEYDNKFAWYEFNEFPVNKSLDLVFEVNLTLNLLDYTGLDIKPQPYNTSDPLYKLFTAYDPLADPTDPAIKQLAQQLAPTDDPLKIAFKAYNFSSSYIKYRLLSSVRGASFALRNGYGDCDEYNTLFIALVRARGIPAIGHTAWLADFAPGFETTDEGAVAHAYPMFYVERLGLLPVDPTRGNKNLYDNWLKTDYKRITLTRGPDHPYRLLKYRWVPQENVSDPNVVSNYTIQIIDMSIKYFSLLRATVLSVLVGIPIIFVSINIIQSYRSKKEIKRKLEKMLNP